MKFQVITRNDYYQVRNNELWKIALLLKTHAGGDDKLWINYRLGLLSTVIVKVFNKSWMQLHMQKTVIRT